MTLNESNGNRSQFYIYRCIDANFTCMQMNGARMVSRARQHLIFVHIFTQTDFSLNILHQNFWKTQVKNLLAPLGAFSRRSDRDNRPSHPIPSIHPYTYSSDCSKPFYSDLKQTVTDRDCL